MKKIIVMELPENVTEVSVSYTNLLGVRFAGRVKAHALPSYKEVPEKSKEDFINATIQTLQDSGFNECLDLIRKMED